MASVLDSTELPGGLRLASAERGDPGGVSVLLVPGLGDSWRSFERVLPLLPGSIRAVALTMRGHGDSSRPAEGYRYGDFASDLAAYMDVRGLGRAVIAGHSLGALVATRFALDHPERVLGLVLAGGFRTIKDDPDVRELRDAFAAQPDPVPEEFVRAFQTSAARVELVPPDFFEMVVEESSKLPRHVWTQTLDGVLEEDFSAELGRIRVPTVIVWGDLDAFSGREEQDALCAAIPGARLLIYSGIGHGVHWEDPERFAADLAAFVEGLAS